MTIQNVRLPGKRDDSNSTEIRLKFAKHNLCTQSKSDSLMLIFGTTLNRGKYNSMTLRHNTVKYILLVNVM
jgi:hypothetical protein